MFGGGVILSVPHTSRRPARLGVRRQVLCRVMYYAVLAPNLHHRASSNNVRLTCRPALQ